MASIVLSGCATGAEYIFQKTQCEKNGWIFSGDIENMASWKCVKPSPPPVIVAPDNPAPMPEEIPTEPEVVEHTPEPTPEPVAPEMQEEPVIECENTATNYCGESLGHTFKASGHKVTFVVTGIENISDTRFIYWMEDAHGNWYNSILYGAMHRGMYNDSLVEHGGHDFDPTKEYRFVVAWGNERIVQEIYEGDQRICQIKHVALFSNIRWAKIGQAAHGETAFKIIRARIEM